MNSRAFMVGPLDDESLRGRRQVYGYFNMICNP